MRKTTTVAAAIIFGIGLSAQAGAAVAKNGQPEPGDVKGGEVRPPHTRQTVVAKNGQPEPGDVKGGEIRPPHTRQV